MDNLNTHFKKSLIAAFGVGTVGAMTAFAAAVGFGSLRMRNGPLAQRVMMAAAATLAIVVGGVWLIP